MKLLIKDNLSYIKLRHLLDQQGDVDLEKEEKLAKREQKEALKIEDDY